MTENKVDLLFNPEEVELLSSKKPVVKKTKKKISINDAIINHDIKALKKVYKTKSSLSNKAINLLVENFNKDIFKYILDNCHHYDKASLAKDVLNLSIKFDNENAFDYTLDLITDPSVANSFALETVPENTIKTLSYMFDYDIPYRSKTKNLSFSIVEMNYPAIIEDIYLSLSLKIYKSKTKDNSLKYNKKIEKLFPEIEIISVNNLASLNNRFDLLDIIKSQPLDNTINPYDSFIKKFPNLRWEEVFIKIINNSNGKYYSAFNDKTLLKLYKFLKHYPDINKKFVKANEKLKIMNRDFIKSINKVLPIDGDVLTNTPNDSALYELFTDVMNYYYPNDSKIHHLLNLSPNFILRYLDKSINLLSKKSSETMPKLAKEIDNFNFTLPPYSHANLFDSICFDALEILSKIAKTKTGLQSIEKSLQKDFVMQSFCQNCDFEVFKNIMKESKTLRNFKDDLGNTLLHYYIFFNCRNIANVEMKKLWNIDKNLFLTQNNLNHSCLDLLKALGFDNNLLAKFSNEFIKKELKSIEPIKKKIQSRKRKIKAKI